MEEVYVQFKQDDDNGPPELEGDVVEYVEEADLISESTVDERDFVYNCNACNATFASVEDHIREHHPEEQVVVEVEEEVEGSGFDEKAFGFKEVAQDEEEGFKCTVCHTLLKSARSLKLHIKMHDPKDREKKEVHSENHCQPCNRSFQDFEHFLLHMAVHDSNEFEIDQPEPIISGEDDAGGGYPCSFCGKRFKRPYEKIKHERVHSGERPYSCKVCGKRFRVSSCLAVHRRTHDDTRPFVCPHCKKSFKIPSVYNHHLKIHSDARAYRCPLCPRAFKTAVSLHGHRKTHTKPFPCSECGRPFGSLYSARKHLHQVHQPGGKASHACGICGAVYGRAAALKQHLREEHGTIEIVDKGFVVLEEEIDGE